MTPKVTEEYLESRRQQILDAAVICFSRKGFHQATLDDVCKEAELSKGAVYNYFKSKGDIVAALQRQWGELDASVFSLVARGGSPLEQLTQVIDASCQRMVQPESNNANRLGVLLCSEMLLNRRIWEGQMTLVRAWREEVGKSVRAAQEVGQVNPGLDPDSITYIVTAALLGLCIQITWEPDLDVMRAVEVLRAMLNGNFKQSSQ